MNNLLRFNKTLSYLDVIKLLVIAPVIYLYCIYFSKQSWGYFTINPRQVIISSYKIENSEISKEPYVKTVSSYQLGMSRKGRYLYDQMFKITNNVQSGNWMPYNADSVGHYISMPFTDINLKGNNKGFEKGKYIFFRTQRISDTVINGQLQLLQKHYYKLVELQ